MEIAYSGGKDSDVILQLAREAGVPFRAIYRCTTIDPPGTIAHCRENGVEILRPRDGVTFFGLMERSGIPNMFMRFCCGYLKEYKVLDKCVMGIRREESVKRKLRYHEPTECRFYGSRKEHVEAIYPILDWTYNNILHYVKDRGIRLHPLYYDEKGRLDLTRRLGCIGCPMAGRSSRREEFRMYPGMLRAYVRHAQRYLDTHPDSGRHDRYRDACEWMYRELFFGKQEEWDRWIEEDGVRRDCRKLLEDYFDVRL